MSNTVSLNRKEFNDIRKILKLNPTVESFSISTDSSSGIGRITTLEFDAKLNKTKGKFTVQISNEESW